MQKQTLSLSFPIFFLMLFSLLRPISTANSNIYVKCSQQYFTPSTAYESNLNSLFTCLVESASVSNFNKFEISTTPGDSEAGDIVYGLFQCRGDLNTSNCRDCVTSSVSQLKTGCPVSTSGSIQLEGCFVKYDNTPFFGVENKTEVANKCGPSISHNSDLQKRIDDAFAYLTSGFNGQYFRGGSFGSIQGVAQCVQDLSVNDCQDCLSEASAQLRSECGTSSWGNIYLGTCYIQYADTNNDGDAGDGDRPKYRGRRKSMKAIFQGLGYVGNFILSIGIGYGNYYNTDRKYKKSKDEANAKIKKVRSDLQEEVDAAQKKAAAVQNEIEQLRMMYPTYCGMPTYNPCGCR